MLNNKPIGNFGEGLACNYLKKQGYNILERNYRIKGGEIDIVAREGNVLVFIEVKTRFTHEYGLPQESITSWKLSALLKTALFYIQKVNWGDREYRIDFISIDFSEEKDNPRIELIKNITS